MLPLSGTLNCNVYLSFADGRVQTTPTKYNDLDATEKNQALKVRVGRVPLLGE